MDWELHRPAAPATPSSLSSGNSGGSSARTEKTPNFKQLSPSQSVAALSKIPDPELRMKGPDELVRLLRRVEADYKSLLGEHGNVVKDVNRRLQIFVLETRSLKENVHKLQEDNQELRDLCCFLDDDRQRGRKLAREWQRFGRYTASVMRSEVAVYQEKLKELEDRQSELVTENMDLKELCLYLDQERLRITGDRDEGDGSSNGTITGPEDGVVSPTVMETSGSITPTPTAVGNYPSTPSSTASYIKELEMKVQRLEEEKKRLAVRIDGSSVEDILKTYTNLEGAMESDLSHPNKESVPASMTNDRGYLRKSPVTSKPEAVVHAMKVLEVHEELEKSSTEEDLDAPEKAIVREMCNVVWRKLGDVGDVGNLNESSDSLTDPPFMAQSPGKADSQVPASSSAVTQNPAHNQAKAHSYSLAQPQPQMASTPLASVPPRTALIPLDGNFDQETFRNDPYFKPLSHAGEKNLMSRPATDLSHQASPGGHNPMQQQQQQQRQQLPYSDHPHRQQPSYPDMQQPQPSPLFHGPSDPQSSNFPHQNMYAPPSKPSMQHPHHPTSFPLAQPDYSYNQRQPLRHGSSSSSNPSAFSSAKDTQPMPPPSPTKSVSEHLPFSHPNFQHRHQPHQMNHPGHHHQVSANIPTGQASFRPNDPKPQVQQWQSAQQPSPYPGQPQTSQASHRSVPPSVASAPYRPAHQHPQPQQPNRPGGPSADVNPRSSQQPQPAVVRLLGAPGNRSQSAEGRDQPRGGGGPSSVYQRAAPGGPPLPASAAEHAATYQSRPHERPDPGPNYYSRPHDRLDSGPSYQSRPHERLDSGLPHNQPRPRVEDRGILSSRDPAPRNPSSSSSDPNQYAPLSYSQDGLKAPGFKAYPPQPSILPNQSGPAWGMGPRPTHATDRAGQNPGQPPPPNSNRGNVGHVQPNFSAGIAQSKGAQGKWFQEQEWRQTYLDDSDTL